MDLPNGALQSSRSSTIQLDKLPTEILKRIATYLPCQSALNLMRTSRQFHHIINDRIVFKAMIENGNSYSGKTMTAWVASIQSYLPSNSSASQWARLAHANDMAAQLIGLNSTKGHPWEDSPKEEQSGTGLMSWLPQLMVLHHPITPELHPPGLLSRISPEYSHSSDDLAASEFCLSLLTLKLSVSKRVEDLSSFMDVSGHLREWGPNSRVKWDRITHICMLVLWLRRAIQRRHVSIWPPVPSTIPLTSFMDLPIPFSPNATKGFSTCHLRTMTSAEFLEDGKWTGYYSLSLNFDTMFQPPLVDIQFSSSAPKIKPNSNPNSESMRDTDLDPLASSESKVPPLKATGSDHRGIFVAVGGISKDGRMQMKETNHAGQIWLWDLEMTPFGLTGTWGTREVYRGLLWLWKKDWCYIPSEEGKVDGDVDFDVDADMDAEVEE